MPRDYPGLGTGIDFGPMTPERTPNAGTKKPPDPRHARVPGGYPKLIRSETLSSYTQLIRHVRKEISRPSGPLGGLSLLWARCFPRLDGIHRTRYTLESIPSAWTMTIVGIFCAAGKRSPLDVVNMLNRNSPLCFGAKSAMRSL